MEKDNVTVEKDNVTVKKDNSVAEKDNLTVEKEKTDLRRSPKKHQKSPYDSPKKGPTLSTSTSSFEEGLFFRTNEKKHLLLFIYKIKFLKIITLHTASVSVQWCFENSQIDYI